MYSYPTKDLNYILPQLRNHAYFQWTSPPIRVIKMVATMIRLIHQHWDSGKTMTPERFAEIREFSQSVCSASIKNSNYACNVIWEYWNLGEQLYREMFPREIYRFCKPRIELRFIFETKQKMQR
jgi:hypothetical protein